MTHHLAGKCIWVLALVTLACAGRQEPVLVPASTPPPPPVDAAVLSSIMEKVPPPPPSSPVTGDEISRVLDAVIGDSLVLPRIADPSEMDVASDLEVLAFASHDRVMHFVELFTGSSRQKTEQWLSRGTQYEKMIRTRLRLAGMPEDLYYLAFIESGFDPDAYSRSAAVGIWQFMTTTAKGEGLRVDWWVDERRDPALATDAAVRHLSWLRRQFGSLFLAAAAYNGGSGTVSRGLTRHASAIGGTEGEEVFFALAETNSLRQETRDYVPKLIAATLVAKNPRKYGLQVDSLAEYVYDSVKAAPSTPMAAIAKAAGVPTSRVAELNPHVLRGVTHPRDSMYIRVPAGTAAAYVEGYAELDSKEKTAFTRTTTKRGETFSAVAKRVGVSASKLAWYNPKDGRGTRALAVGTTILVPSAAVLSAARDIPDPAREVYGSGGRHVVKRGETLGGIAARYGITVTALKRLNGLRSDAIRAGQTLKVR